MELTFLVTSSTTVLGKPAGTTLTAKQLEGCDIDALIFGGHITPNGKPSSTPAPPTTKEQE